MRITPDPSWKEGSKRGTHVVSIDRLKLYHSKTIRAPDSKLDIEMIDNEFLETINLGPQGEANGKDFPGEPEKKEKGKKEESDDNSDNDLGPSSRSGPIGIQPRQGPPRPAIPPRGHPNTPKPTKKPRKPPPKPSSPPQTRAQAAKEAKKRASAPGQSQGPRTARPDPGLNWQPRVEITPIPAERIHQETAREPRVELTPIPPDMLNYYKNYRSPGRGKSWGPTNRPPAPTHDRPAAPADSQPTPPKTAHSSSQ